MVLESGSMSKWFVYILSKLRFNGPFLSLAFLFGKKYKGKKQTYL